MAPIFRSLLLAGCIAAVSFPLNAAIFYDYEGIMHTFKSSRINSMTVCQFKQIAARKLGLLATEFTVTADGKALPGKSTFKELGLSGDFKLNIRKTRHSDQC